jgi:hypothetical protein
MGEPGRWRLETAEVSALASTANEARTDINNTTKQKALMEGYFAGILLCSLHSIFVSALASSANEACTETNSTLEHKALMEGYL